jgi:prepilin-type processing-associated H-X9-DG protein
VQPYAKNEGIFNCPSYDRKMRVNTAVNPPRFYRAPSGSSTAEATGGTLPTGVDYSYGINEFNSPSGYEGPFNPKYRTLASMPSPAGVAGMADSRGSSAYSITGGSGSRDFASVEAQVDGRRHPGNSTPGLPSATANIMFMDGHAKFTNIAQSMRPNVWSTRDDD